MSDRVWRIEQRRVNGLLGPYTHYVVVADHSPVVWGPFLRKRAAQEQLDWLVEFHNRFSHTSNDGNN